MGQTAKQFTGEKDDAQLELPSQDSVPPATPLSGIRPVENDPSRSGVRKGMKMGKGRGNGPRSQRPGQNQPGQKGKKRNKKGQQSNPPGPNAAAAQARRPSQPPSGKHSSRPSGIQISTSTARVDSTAPSATPPALEVEIPPPPIAPADLEEKFFSEPHLPVVREDHEHEEAVRHPKMTAAAHARRAHLSRYVKWTVACAGALCALALVRVSLSGKGLQADAAAPPKVEAVQAEPKAEPAPPPADPPAGDKPAADQAPVQVAAPPAAEPKAEAPATPPTPQAAAEPAPAAAAAAPAPDGKTALQEKKDAKSALERGQIKTAIEAGERSVALDPTDGEAWLVLGAAYQEKGKIADARRAFTSCIKQGKKGPIAECSAMLR